MWNAIPLCAAVSALTASGLPLGGRLVSVGYSPSVNAPSVTCVSLAIQALRQFGVTPASLAAVGASDEEVSQIVLAARAYCESHAVQIEAVAAERSRLAGLIQSLEDRVRQGSATVEHREELAQARANFTNLGEGEPSHLDTIADVLASSLTAEQQGMLASIVALEHTDVPVTLRTVPRSDAELAAMRCPATRANAHQGDPDAAVAWLLCQARTADVTTAWQAAMGN